MQRPLIITGPSGSGKTTVLSETLKRFPGKFTFSISHTTRHPRDNETNGIEYYFVTEDQMNALIDSDEIIEYTRFSDNLYGTSKASIKQASKPGKICVLDLDINGVLSLQSSDMNPVCVFIMPPSIEDLEQRLRCRSTETPKSMSKRIQEAERYLDFYNKNSTIYDCVIYNYDVSDATNDLVEFLIQSYPDVLTV